jgi:hypothetical protein
MHDDGGDDDEIEGSSDSINAAGLDFLLTWTIEEWISSSTMCCKELSQRISLSLSTFASTLDGLGRWAKASHVQM